MRGKQRVVDRYLRYGVVVSALAVTTPARSAETFQSYTWYLGDLHSHTGYSGDAASQETGCSTCGAQADLIATAQANGLDFVAFTDHVNGVMTESGIQFKKMVALATANTVDDAFVVLPAAEVYFQTSSTNRFGHKTILLFGDDTALSSLEIKNVRPNPANPYGNISSCDDIDTFLSSLSSSFGEVLALPHHPAATIPTPTDWSCHFDAWEPAVEVDSVHGNSLSASLAWEPLNKGVTATGYADQAIDPDVWGYQLGFVGGTDRHDTMPGEVCQPDQGITKHIYGGALTIAALPTGTTFDRGAIYDAIVSRHTEATSGPMIPVDVRYSVDGADVGGFGDDIEVREGHDLTVTVSVPSADASYVTDVTLVVPGGESVTLEPIDASTWSATLASADVPEVAYAQVQIDGTSWWSSGCDDGDGGVDYVWPSPSRFKVVGSDDDHDGVTVQMGDCDDADPRSYPGAPEVWYDGVDEDCLGGDDDDADGDGVDAEVAGGADCDDEDATTFPGASDLPYDGIVNDCDPSGEFDADGDGYDAAVVGGDDCDDTDAGVHPDAPDAPYDGVIADCDPSGEFDADLDGYEAAPWGDDCDDAAPDVHPGAADPWYDGVDQDCDGASDFDADGDGHETGSVGGDDCDDGDPSVYPGAPEIWYDGVDEDCLGGDDDDADGDGVDAEIAGGGDCDDADPTTYPDAPDLPYDGIINDCDLHGEYDADGDGYVAADFGGDDCDDRDAAVHPGAWDVHYDGVIADCDPSDEVDADLDGHAASPWGDDCDDVAADVHPDAVEVWYDGVDEDCDGRSDFDADGDGHDTHAVGGDDCDDGDPDVWPGAPDTPYDGVIDDCDARDELDADLDGHEAVAVGGDDCDDANSLVHPGAVETWYDGVDADCDGGSDFDADRDGAEIAPRGDDCDDHDPTVQACDTGRPAVDAPDRPRSDALDTAVTPPPAGRPCGCDTGGAPPFAGLGLTVALLSRRRRRKG